MIKKLLRYLKISESTEIARRYFIINGFDGAITILGVILGSYYVGVVDHNLIFGIGFGTSLAIAISGITGVYLSEKAEKEKELRDIEKAMLRKMRKTDVSKALNASVIIIALIDGLSPFFFGMLIILPFKFSWVDISTIYYVSFGICALLLLSIGLFLGRIAKKNMLIWGGKTILVGVITALVLLLLKVV